MKIDGSQFLITGLPRSRTAWLSALMNAHGTFCIHEMAQFFHIWPELTDWLDLGTQQKPHGIVDGFASINYPINYVTTQFANHPIVVIVRNINSVKESWLKWEGHDERLNQRFDEFKANWENFLSNLPSHALVVPYERLNNYQSVSRLCHYVTDRPLNPLHWRLFDQLQIELHSEKAWKWHDLTNVELKPFTTEIID